MKQASTSVLRDHARRNGMRTLRECGLLSIFEGQTTIDEVVRETIMEEEDCTGRSEDGSCPGGGGFPQSRRAVAEAIRRDRWSG